MSDFTLTVPAESVDLFRSAAMCEVECGADNVHDEAAGVIRRLGKQPADWDITADVRGSLGIMERDLAVVAELAKVEDGEAATVTADPATLAHIAEAMARQVIPGRLEDVTGTSPFGHDEAEQVRTLSGSLEWAAEQAAALRDAWEKSRNADGKAS